MILELRRCTFGYAKAVSVVRDFSLQLDGERTVMLGPNGAGKSTILALAAGALTPRSGSVILAGNEPGGRRARREHLKSVAWLPQAAAPVSGCTVREQVALHGWLKGMSRAQAWDAAPGALDRVGLADQADRKSTALSGGQQARVGLAQALVHEPRVLLLDEPTAALDPSQRERFVGLLTEHAADRTVLVSTHDVNDLASAFDRVVVLDEGRVVHDGTVQAFLAGPGGAPLSPVAAYRRLVDTP